MSYVRLKRILDLLGASISLLFLWPLLLIISILIKLNSNGPVLFRQKRIGINRSEFYIYKFRTMRADTPNDMPTHLLSRPDIFITSIGKFLRKSSLDELPQLFNIFRGDMSFVGPRPSLWNQYDLIQERDKYNVNSIVPGLTGWAQINGRDELPIEIKAKLDGEYLERMSLPFDIKCVLLTFIKVFKSEGIIEGKGQLDEITLRSDQGIEQESNSNYNL